jgi:hypothetical protein
MNHATDDQLLLLAYGELPQGGIAPVESHLAGCAACRAQLGRLESGRVALDGALPGRRSRLRWIAAGLAAAAILAAVLLTNPPQSPGTHAGWKPTSNWSATAGYVTGGRALVEIDEQLTRLEQERSYARP